MKAITLWQPWASLLACEAKRYETRSWATTYRGPIVIHAAKRPFDTDCYLDRELYPYADALGLADIYSFHTLPTGCIVATAELIDCHLMLDDGSGKRLSVYLQRPNYAREYIQGKELFFGDWKPGRYAWEFSNMHMLNEPIPAKGGQRIWNWQAGEGAE